MATSEPAPPPESHPDAGAPDWRSAYLRLREQEPTEVQPPLPLPAARAGDAAPETTAVRSVSDAPTATRIEAIRQLAEPDAAAAPAARSWQVELPALHGPAWQLHVEQVQPLAPLNLELRVPQVVQAQARQQLSDLDKRLRDAGHDVLKLRLRDTARTGERFRPIDEIER